MRLAADGGPFDLDRWCRDNRIKVYVGEDDDPAAG